MAGRDQAKLERVRAELAARTPAAAGVPILSADPSDTSALDALVGSGRVVLTLAGPYAKHGGPVVASAARMRTDYCDITGARRGARAAWEGNAAQPVMRCLSMRPQVC
jgi:short subunit dehydrogenase-like uncharacterized protein